MLKRFLFGTAAVQTGAPEIALLILRVFAGLAMAFAHGLGKFPPSDQFIARTGEMGFPIPILFAWLAVISELGGGLALAAGFMTRLASFGIASTMVVAAFMAHGSDPFQKKELSLLYLAVALVFLAIGSGRFGLDRFFRK